MESEEYKSYRGQGVATLADQAEPGWIEALDQYLEELKGLEPLTAAKELEVARRAKAGDSEALEHLVSANLRFVVSVAKRYRGRGLLLEDLIAEGNVGLLTAARKFDPDKGYKFITYAVWWIRQAIQAAIATQGNSVRVPIQRPADLGRLAQGREKLQEKLHRNPTPEELAAETQLSVDIVKALSSLSMPTLRLSVPLSNTSDQEPELADVHSDTAQLAMDTERSETIAKALQTLPSRHALVLRKLYGLAGEEPHTLAEIGAMLGISRARVGQLKERALEKLRENATLAGEWDSQATTKSIGGNHRRFPRRVAA